MVSEQSLGRSTILKAKSTSLRMCQLLNHSVPRLSSCTLSLIVVLAIDIEGVCEIIHDIHHLTQFLVNILHVTLELLIILLIICQVENSIFILSFLIS